MSESDAAISDEAMRIERDALFTAQTNFVKAATFRRLHFWLGLPAVALATIASATVVADWSTTIAGICAVVAAILIALQTFLNPERQSADFNSLGADYRTLQHEARRLRRIRDDSTNTEQRRDTLMALAKRQEELNKLNRPSGRAFKKAKKTIPDICYPGDEKLPGIRGPPPPRDE